MNESIQKLLKDRYLLSTEKEWNDIATRVGKIYNPITQDIIDMNFIPSSPTLMNANTNGKRIGTLSSCFPMGIEDSIEGIFDSVKECAITTRLGGGIGIDFSILRSSKEEIKGLDGRLSSGPIAFMENFDKVLDSISQMGSRRGAGMALLDITHPNIIDFIHAKTDLSKLTRMNLSVKIQSSFYETLEKTPNKIHQVKDRKDNWFDLVDKEGNLVSVKQLWDMIISMAHAKAEPGIMNISLAEERCTVTNVTKQVCSNPCGEFVNIPYSSCSLASINLTKYVTSSGHVEWDALKSIIEKGTIFLNNVIDSNRYPIKKIKDITTLIRPIGLGVMGFAHMLFMMNIPYNSNEAIKLAEDLTRFITLYSMRISVDLAKESGKYDSFDYDIFMNANKRFFTRKKCRDIDVESLQNDIKKYGCRNSSQTSYAPTGTISMIANVSSGIEPVFALSYARKIEKMDRQYEVIYITDPLFKKYLEENFDKKTIEKILRETSENKGSCQNIKEIPKEMKNIFVTAGDITPMEHLNVLGSMAPYVSLSVSKTINLPSDISKEKISEVYLEAHKKGIIGVTVYREGSREGILVHNGNGKNKIIERAAPKRPERLPCKIHRVKFKNENWIAFVGLFKGRPYEIFCGAVNEVNLPKIIQEGFILKEKSRHYAFYDNDDEMLIKNIGKSFSNDEHDAFARSISMSLRHGVPLEYVVDTLNKAKGDITHFSRVLARILKDYIEDGTSGGKCPECGEKLIYVGGCLECPAKCGYMPKCG